MIWPRPNVWRFSPSSTSMLWPFALSVYAGAVTVRQSMDSLHERIDSIAASIPPVMTDLSIILITHICR
jgi:hypothetical protein